MTISELLGIPFGIASRVRRASIFHPSGVLYDGHLTRLAPEGIGLPVASSDVRVRLSKAIGSPAGWADIGGLALRLPDSADGDSAWDILLAGAAPTTVGRVMLWPNTSWNAVQFSSLMPLKYDDRLWWLRARITTPLATGMKLAELRTRIAGPGLEIVLEQATGTGAFQPLAVVRSTSVSPDNGEHLAFDPVLNTPESVRPQPEWLRSLRVSAYRHSRSARPDTGSDTEPVRSRR